MQSSVSEGIEGSRPSVVAVPGFGRRIWAFVLDYLPISAYLISLAAITSVFAFGVQSESWQGFMSSPWRADVVAFLTAVLPVILYFAWQEGSVAGATWGKRRTGLRVVRSDGSGLGRGRALVRSVLKFLPWQLAHTCLFHVPGWPLDPREPPTWVLAGFVMVWILVAAYLAMIQFGPKRRTLYDLLAGTLVIRDRSS